MKNGKEQKVPNLMMMMMIWFRKLNTGNTKASHFYFQNLYPYYFFLLLFFRKNKSRLMGSSCCLDVYVSACFCVCIYMYISPNNFRMPDPVVIKLGSMSCHLMPSQRSTSQIPPISSLDSIVSQVAEATVPLLLRVDSLLRKRVYSAVA
jgi:hypothetical protein